MKKKLVSAFLVSTLAVSMLAGCGGGDAGTSGTGGSDAGAQTGGAATDGAAGGTEAADSGASGGTTAAGGSVYYLNFKPEADQAWQDLAAAYTAQTGVEVKVVTAASGEYESTLTTEMGKSSAPTLFQVGNDQAVETWKNYCLDLSGTELANELTTEEFNLTGDNGETYAIGYCYEAFGIITNKALLKEAGYEVTDITDFESLQAVAEDITARKDELGFSAFTSAGLEGSSSWRFSGHLANMPLFYEFRDDNVTEQPAEVTGAYLDNF